MRRYRKKDFPVHDVRRFLEPGPIVLVSSAHGNETNIMTMGWHMVMEFSPALIGCLISGKKDGKPRKVFVYNICDHAACYQEVRAQAVSYTTGVPAVSGAVMIAKGIWNQPGVWNMEQLDPDPFLADVAARGLPWHVEERPA